MKNTFKILMIVSTLALGLNIAQAEETTSEKIETTANKTTDAVKEGYRSAKDKGCEMINGKMECAGKKLKHKAENVKDKAGTKATEIQNKVD